MAIRRLDALVDAFAHLNGWHDPKSDAYQLRNPLLLKAFSPKHEKDEQGRRRFTSFASGYDNGILDVSIKCSGKSHSKLTPDSTLQDLVIVYGNSIHATRGVKNFLRAALKNDNILETQRLGWFLEDKDANLRHSKPAQSEGLCGSNLQVDSTKVDGARSHSE